MSAGFGVLIISFPVYMTFVASTHRLEDMAALVKDALLPRFIEPQRGRVLFDSEDINWGTLESLRAETIYVGGADPFFTGTVFENIRGGDAQFSLQDVTEAAKLTHAHNFILRLAQGYETVLGEHGEQLEAGERVRVESVGQDDLQLVVAPSPDTAERT